MGSPGTHGGVRSNSYPIFLIELNIREVLDKYIDYKETK
jgi:hypothetical protein